MSKILVVWVLIGTPIVGPNAGVSEHVETYASYDECEWHKGIELAKADGFERFRCLPIRVYTGD